jgi:hypothetical protein
MDDRRWTKRHPQEGGFALDPEENIGSRRNKHWSGHAAGRAAAKIGEHIAFTERSPIPGPAGGLECILHPASIVPAPSNLEVLIHEHNYDPADTADQAQSALVLKGRLDVVALEAALSDLVARHEALRTTYRVDANGGAVQTIHPPWTAILQVEKVDAGARPGAAPAPAAGGLPVQFEPEKLPLICWSLTEIGDTEHVLRQVEHRFLHDEWSSKILKRELAHFYTIRTSAKHRPSPPDCSQFRKFCAHERHWLNSHACKKSINFWRDYLRGAGALLELRGAKHRSAKKTFGGKQRRLSLPYSNWALIGAAAERLRVTPFQLMFSVFSELVGELSGTSDFLIGTEVANRAQSEFHDTVGMIANLLPVRLRRDEGEPWRTRMAKYAGSLQQALAHEAVPLPAIMAVADLHGRRVGTPPVQVCFSFHRAPARDELPFAGLNAEAVEQVHYGSVKHELAVTVTPPAAGGDLSLVVAYNTSVYYDAIVDAVIGDYVGRLAALNEAVGR